MKKLFILSLTLLVIGSSVFAAPASNNERANSHFMNTFKKAKYINWEKKDNFEKVSFVINNELTEVFYDLDGELIGKSRTMSFDKLPKNAIERITTEYQFPEYQLIDCIEFVKADKETNYYISFQSKNETIVVEISSEGNLHLFSRY